METKFHTNSVSNGAVLTWLGCRDTTCNNLNTINWGIMFICMSPWFVTFKCLIEMVQTLHAKGFIPDLYVEFAWKSLRVVIF